jgi:uncharacterized phage protein (TIGR01671 family)
MFESGGTPMMLHSFFEAMAPALVQDRASLMQFTGFLDSKGKEIYFDDIVRYAFFDPDNEGSYEAGTALICETMSNGVGLLYDYKASAPDKTWAVAEGGLIQEYWDDEDLWTIEVIGNRFENPDLITPCEGHKE